MDTPTWECPQVCDGAMLHRGVNQSQVISVLNRFFFFFSVFNFVSIFFGFFSRVAFVHTAMLNKSARDRGPSLGSGKA